MAHELMENVLQQKETLTDLMDAKANQQEVFSTIEDSIEVYNTINGEASRLKEAVNKKLVVSGLVIHQNESVDDETGELVNGYRMIFITDKGLFSTSSKSVFNNVKQLNMFKGLPSVKNPWLITPTLKKGSKFEYLTLQLNG